MCSQLGTVVTNIPSAFVLLTLSGLLKDGLSSAVQQTVLFRRYLQCLQATMLMTTKVFDVLYVLLLCWALFWNQNNSCTTGLLV